MEAYSVLLVAYHNSLCRIFLQIESLWRAYTIYQPLISTSISVASASVHWLFWEVFGLLGLNLLFNYHCLAPQFLLVFVAPLFHLLKATWPIL